MVTWAKHLQEGWQGFLTENGQWQYKRAIAGRQARRRHLLNTFLDGNFVDPHPDGCPGLYLGPSVNMIHPPGGVLADPGEHRRSKLNVEECYPNTRIPLTTIGMMNKSDLFLDISESPLTVVTDFLNGRMAFSNNHHKSNYHVLQADRVESAFFHLGWRVDWRAVYKANKHVRGRYVKLAVNSRPWLRHPPVQFDKLQQHTDSVIVLTRRLRNEKWESDDYHFIGDSDDDGSDGDDDSDNSEESDESSGKGKKAGKGGGGLTQFRNQRDVDSISVSDSDNDEQSGHFDGKAEKGGKGGGGLTQPRHQRDVDSSSDYDSDDFWPPSSSMQRRNDQKNAKGKGRAIDRLRMFQKHSPKAVEVSGWKTIR